MLRDNRISFFKNIYVNATYIGERLFTECVCRGFIKNMFLCEINLRICLFIISITNKISGEGRRLHADSYADVQQHIRISLKDDIAISVASRGDKTVARLIICAAIYSGVLSLSIAFGEYFTAYLFASSRTAAVQYSQPTLSHTEKEQ